MNYNGKLYKFTVNHTAGIWTGTDVIDFNIIRGFKEEIIETDNATRQYLSLNLLVRRGNIQLSSGKWFNLTLNNNNQWHIILNIEKYIGKPITVIPGDHVTLQYSGFLYSYNAYNGEKAAFVNGTSLNTKYPTDSTIPNGAKYLYLYITAPSSSYALPKQITIDGRDITDIEGRVTDIEGRVTDIEGSDYITTSNKFGSFIKELYVDNLDEVSNFHIRGIKRNYNGFWQFTIRANSGDSEVTICNYIFTSSEKEKETFVIHNFYTGKNGTAYFIIDWSGFEDGTEDNHNYYLSNAAFDLNMCPIIKSYIEKQDKLISGTNIKTVNGHSILGAGNIEIESGGHVTNIINHNVNNSYNIGNVNVANSLVEKKTLFGNSITIDGAVSNELPKISIFSKPNVQTLGSDNNISFPSAFNLKINSDNKTISNSNSIRSIKFRSNKNTEVGDFTYSDDSNDIYISDSIEIYNGKYYYIQRVEEKIWHTGEDEPEIYLSNKADGLVDGATIYVPKSDVQTQELGDISISVNNGDIITTDNSSYLYLQIEELIPKQIVENPLILTKCAELKNEDGITVIGRNVTFDEENDILYICAYSGILYKIDVSDDRHPKLLGSLTVNSTAGHVCSGCAIKGNYLYVVDRNEGVATSPSYLTVINKSTFSIEKQINVYDENEFTHNSAQSPCSCAIDERGYLFIPENSYFWAIYDITTNPKNPSLLYQQTYNSYSDKAYREYQRVVFFKKNSSYYAVFCGFSSGFSIWDVTNVSAPTKIGQIELSPMQSMDLLIDYPYIYAPCSGQLWNRFSHNKLCRSIIRFDLSDLSKYSSGVSFSSNPELFTISQIPYDKFYPSITREGDPAPSRITKIGDFIAVNYAEAGTAVFRLINSIPVFQSCYQLAGKGNTIQPLYATEDGRLFQVNIYGTHKGMQVYRLGNVNY